MKPHIYIVLLALTLTSCFERNREPRNNVFRPEFDISMNNRNIVCSFYENDIASIYQIDRTDNRKTRLSPTTKYSLIKPVYSPNNKQIACLAESLTDDIKSKICLIDINSKKIRDLTSDSLLILECIFNPDGQSIYFTASKHFGNYSPLARKAPHDIDIYRIDIATRKIKKITEFNSYDLHGISITTTGDSMLFRLKANDKNGLFLMSINTKNLIQISSSHDIRSDEKASPYEYYKPVLSRDNSKIAFSEPYELYILDRETRISKLIFRNEKFPVNIGEARFFNSYNYLMVTLPTDSKMQKSTGENYGFYTLNPETNELRTLEL